MPRESSSTKQAIRQLADPLIDSVAGGQHYVSMKWLHEPRRWNVTDGDITMTSDPKTDFWRITHDGGLRDNGHLYYESVSGDFEVSLLVEGEFRDLYDQVGLMLRIDERTWLKCGIEFFEGRPHRSVVVTREFSDWSIAPYDASRLWIRAKRSGATAEISFSDDGRDFAVFRQAYLSDRTSIDVGLMAASPIGDGFEARFRDFAVR